MSSARNRIRAVDLFCGLGGLTHGLGEGRVQVTAGIDIDPACRYPYEANNGAEFIERDVLDLTGDELSVLYKDAKIRLLAGCAPCQPFSTYSRKGRAQRQDAKWQLVSEFGRLIREVQPELVTMENVPQLSRHEVFREFLDSLAGYSVWWSVIECARFGVPQTRKRLVLLASHFGPIALETSPSGREAFATVRQAIAGLHPLVAGEADPDDALHIASTLSELNLRRIRASKPGGTWRDWDESLVAECHRKGTGQTYPSVYGRMEWDAPAPTITTQCFGYGNGRFGHPEQDRAISLREAAILQTFPRDYQFVAPGEHVRFDRLGRLIGNAVPVRIGEVVAESLVKHVEQYGEELR